MNEMEEPFLNVKQSLTNKIWVKPSNKEQRLATNLQQVSSLPYPLAVLLAQRQITADQIEMFLNPKIKDTLPKPSSFHDMDAAIEILSKAVSKKNKIAIFADYDVDGGTSSALLYNWLLHFGLKPSVYVPDRIKEGYGPNNEAMKSLAEDHDIIVCVDCGTLSFEPISIAKTEKCKVIVVDHHLASNELPIADAIINPNRADETSLYKYLCAAGVVFLLLVGLNTKLKKNGHQVPDLLFYLDLVALATIADVVPLVGLNRAYVKTGLRILQERYNVGLSALMDIANINGKIRVSDLGFSLGPRINAGGRLGNSKLAVDLLIERDISKAEMIAKTLNSLNDDRKLIEAEMLDKALDIIKSPKDDENLIWVAQEDWNPGLTGILASRLREKFGKPTIAIAIDQNGIGKGSGRSIPNLNLGLAVNQLSEEKLIAKGGGHAQAVGITFKKDKIKTAMERLSDILKDQKRLKKTPQKLNITSLISVNAITAELIEKIEEAGPFGAGAQPPIFVLANCRIKWLKVIANQHLRFVISDDSNSTIQSIFFRAMNDNVGNLLNQNQAERFHFAGNLEINDWSGRKTPNFIIKDVSLIT